jgi:GntR family transcriptional regulator/MocR family aminotransferase
LDQHGIDVAALQRSGADAVVVTPAHQFPTRAVLAAPRRAGLIEWLNGEIG